MPLAEPYTEHTEQSLTIDHCRFKVPFWSCKPINVTVAEEEGKPPASVAVALFASYNTLQQTHNNRTGLSSEPLFYPLLPGGGSVSFLKSVPSVSTGATNKNQCLLVHNPLKVAFLSVRNIDWASSVILKLDVVSRKQGFTLWFQAAVCLL